MQKTETFILTFIFIFSFYGCGDSQKVAEDTGYSAILDLDSFPLATLNSEQKFALAHMWNEEKLAHDLYLALNEVQAASQFVNIATKSEVTHIELVENLVARYDINITNLADYTIAYSEAELRAMDAGVFGVSEIQTLYNDLYNRGKINLQAALEVGCIVEVVDVDDLNIYINDTSYPEDLVSTFKILRDGSYKHYWAFDGALKQRGVSEGCCVLGDTYCKNSTEYPQ